jgi:threonylcarbamoyladenosine tRNA methylthiotransferase MtaB
MRVAIATLGCKVNQYDSAVIQNRLEEKCLFVPFDEEADCYIINTCTVTDRADWEARQLVRRAKRRSPAAKVLITGCYAQVSPHEVVNVPGVDYVVGLNRLEDLVRLVESPLSSEQKQIAVQEVKRERGVPVLGTRALPGHTRAFLKIQEGCNYSCTYCIIPTARGLSRSVPVRQVMEEVRRLADAGYLEIVLTGIHLGGYGHDLSPRMELASLLNEIAESGLLRRIRLSSLDPREVTDRLLDVVAESPVICSHLHVCAQAGDDTILREMRRNYDAAYYRDLLLKIRERLPDASLGSDIIVGFPGETDEQFEKSYEYFRSLPLTYFHVFPYSCRRGTIAASLSNPVPPDQKKHRAKRMRDLGFHKKREFAIDFLGRNVRVLIEENVQRRPRYQRGFTMNYLSVMVRSAHGPGNREVEVRLDGWEDGFLTGTLGATTSAEIQPV